MKVLYWEHRLRLRHPFILSDSRIDHKDVVLVSLSSDGIVGVGESSPSRYFGESVESVRRFLETVEHEVSAWDPWHRQHIVDDLEKRFPADRSARSAIDMALWDWHGKAVRQPVHRLLGLDPGTCPISSMTIGLDEPDRIRQKLDEASGFPLLKIKLGRGDQDYEMIETVRRMTDRPIRVDVNEGWSREEAVRKIEWLTKRGTELVEQPLPKENIDDMLWVRDRVSLPLFADESVMNSRDLPSVAGCFSGVNIKLDKCGGMTEALRMIHGAQLFGLQTMLGCMVQSSVGISAAAQISPLTNFADLDGHLLINNDPAKGVSVRSGHITLGDQPGIGVQDVQA